jgi:hypothetical protein
LEAGPVANYGRKRQSHRTVGFGNRNASARGFRLPLENARSGRLREASGPDLKLIETALAEFKSDHPYLLFNKPAIARIRARANSNPKLLVRLETSLSEDGSATANQELRTRIKRQSRRLIHTSFLALISHGAKRAEALHATRIALSGFTAETSWKARPVIKSFLDCAEIAVAVSLAYDWLYHEFSDEERGRSRVPCFGTCSSQPSPRTMIGSCSGQSGATIVRSYRIPASCCARWLSSKDTLKHHYR